MSSSASSSAQSSTGFGWVLNLLNESMKEDPEMPLAMAAYRAFNEVLRRTKEETTHGLIVELGEATDYLVSASSNISLKSIAQIYMFFITGASRNWSGSSFEELKKELQARGKELEDRTKSARDQIATLSSPFFRDGVVVMTHGYSRVVFSVLKYAAQREKRITVIATESMPQNNGVSLAQRLAAEGIPVQLISDSAAAHMMDQVDLVFVGAEAVVENGGIINNMGTYQLALVAKAHSKPFYVAAETYKMTRDFPLDQKSIPIQTYSHDHLQALPVSTTESKNRDACVPTWHQPMLDYTPPQYISLLFTDLTVLTPSAVSDELIKFDQVVPERNFS